MAHVAAVSARDILDPHFLAPTDRVGIEDHEIRESAWRELAAIGDAPRVREIGGEALHCALKGHESLLPDEFLDEIARIARAAELVDVCARIGRADMDARVVQQ